MLACILKKLNGWLGHSLLQIFEGALEKVRDIFLKEIFIGCPRRSLLWRVNRLLDFSRLDKVEHPVEKNCLVFKSWETV